MKVGSALEIQLMADVTRLIKDMREAQGVVGDAMGWIEGAAGKAKNALLGLVAGLSVGAFAGMVKGSIDSAAALNDLSIQTGLSVEALSAYSQVGALSETTAEDIGAAMNKLSKNMAVANEESKGTGSAIKALGLDFNSFKQLSPDEQMMALAKAMDQFEDGSGKSAIAMTLLGKEGAKLLPFMKDLATTGELAAIVTKEQAGASDNFGDNLARLQVASAAWKTELAMGMVPALDAGLQAFVDVTTASGGLRDTIRQLNKDGTIKEWTQMAVTGVTYVMDVFSGLINVVNSVGKIVGGVGALIADSFGAAGTIVMKVLKGDFAGALAENEAAGRRQKAIWNDLGSTLDSVWGAKTTGQKIRDRIQDLEAVGVVAEAAKKKMVWSAEDKEAAKAAKEAAAEQKKLQNAYDGVIRSIDEKIAALRGENDAGRQLTEVEKLEIKVMADLRSEKVRATEQGIAYAKQKIEEARAEERVKMAREADLKLAKDRQAARNKDYEDSARALADIEKEELASRKAAQSMLKQLEDEKAALTMTRQERELANAERELERQGIKKGTAAYDEYIAKIRQALLDKDTIEQSVQAQTSMWQTIEGAARDTFISIFDSGKGAFDRLKDTLKNGLYALLYEMTVKRWIISIATSVGGAGVAQQAFGTAATGGGGLLGDIGGLFSSAANIGGVASMFGAGGLLGSLSAGAGWLTGATSLTGALGAAGSLMGTGTAAGMMSGLGMAAGALGPIALGAMALTSLLSKKKGGPKIEGGYATGGYATRGGEANADAATIGQAIQQQYASLAGALGGANQILDTLVFFAKDPKGDSLTQLQIAAGLNGSTVYGNASDQKELFENIGRDDKDLQAAIAQQSSQAVFAALQASNLAPDVVEYFRKFNPFELTAEEIQSITTTATAVRAITTQLEPLGSVFARLGALSIDARNELFAFAGGIDAFMQKTQTYVSAYYTQEEQLAMKAQAILKELDAVGIGASGATSKAQLRDTLDSLTGGTEAERRQIAALLDVAGDYATVADYLTENQMTLGELAGIAPSLSLLAEAQTPTAEAAQATAASVATVADNTSAAVEVLNTVEENTAAVITQNSDFMRRMLDALERSNDLLAAISSSMRQQEAKA